MRLRMVGATGRGRALTPCCPMAEMEGPRWKLAKLVALHGG